MTRARGLFVGGTSSNAGKSWMVTAICAWLRERGVSVAPFKAQNMSNNSFPCRGGGEIGRAQVAQAEACGLAPEPAMNPILLKPCGQGRSQVVVNGRVWKTLSAREYYAHTTSLRRVVLDAYEDLVSRFDAVVIEGAGSVSEINLRDHDLVNLWLVTELDVPWILVADIERGGVFGSVLGTMALLTSDERRLCRGVAVNKFRGDPSLFDEGARMLEARSGVPCLGVFPHVPDIHLDAEDSLALATTPVAAAPIGARTAIVRFPHISNATDFRLLAWAEWVMSPPSVPYDFIVLPGSKNTIADMAWLRSTGLADWIVSQHKRGAVVVGICGGFQMLGRMILDPHRVESDLAAIDGLALVPAVTELTQDKETRTVSATTEGGASFGAYEIHLGRTVFDGGSLRRPFATLDSGEREGFWQDGILGTYLHGALEHPDVCAEIFGVRPAAPEKSAHYARLAAWFAANVRGIDSLELL
jgi:adenosylcobyric acid synthase